MLLFFVPNFGTGESIIDAGDLGLSFVHLLYHHVLTGIDSICMETDNILFGPVFARLNHSSKWQFVNSIRNDSLNCEILLTNLFYLQNSSFTCRQSVHVHM